MDEKRINQRTDLVYYLKIKDKATKKIIGRIGDISDTGLMILSEEKLILNHFYNISIKLPEDNDFNKEEIDMTVKTKWEKPDFNPNYHCVGCEFVNIDKDDEFALRSIIKTLGYNLYSE